MGIVSARWRAIRNSFSSHSQPTSSELLHVLDQLGLGGALLDERGALLHSNTSLAAILRLECVTASAVHELIAKATASQEYAAELPSGTSFYAEHPFGSNILMRLRLIALEKERFLVAVDAAPALPQDADAQSERLREEFIAIVSHEIRTPLTSMLGGLALLAAGRSGALPQSAQRMLQIANESSQRLVRLVNDLLDINKLESGEMSFSIQVVSSHHAMQLAMDGMRHQAEAGCVHLEMRGEDALVLSDPDRLLQVLTNLLSNALKFSPLRAEVRLSCELRDGYAVFVVEDHGRGIPSEKIPHVFDKFSQVDVEDGSRKGGTGLGLAICRQIVERQKGRIWVESSAGAGTAFYFSVPLAVSPRILSGEKRPLVNMDSGAEALR